jgi:hypothetical protein
MQAGAVAGAGGEGAGGEEAKTEDVAVGVHGGQLLLQEISTAPDPRAAIRQFAAGNALKTPSIAPAQEMLDLMDFSRCDQHTLILSQLKSRMLARIPGLPVDKQLALLNKCFKYISIPELRDLPLAIFSNLPKIPSSYLVQFALTENKELFMELPISVKRQVWSLDAQSGHDLFAGHVTRLAMQYAAQARVRASCTGVVHTYEFTCICTCDMRKYAYLCTCMLVCGMQTCTKVCAFLQKPHLLARFEHTHVFTAQTDVASPPKP